MAFGIAFNAIVVRRLGPPGISLIMVTIGLGAMMRGTATLVFAGAGRASAAGRGRPAILSGIPVAREKLVAAAIAAIVIALVTWFYQRSRTGIALRAIADDPQAASASGIDLNRLFGLVWALTGAISVIAGVLWVFVAGGGFGVALVGLKIFPIVIIGGLDSLPGTITPRSYRLGGSSATTCSARLLSTASSNGVPRAKPLETRPDTRRA